MKNCFTSETGDAPTSAWQVPAALFRHPFELLVRRWNWKSALLSSLWRGGIFLLVNLRAGPEAAVGAMLAEFAYRGVTAGFYGAITQAFRSAEPRWAATAVAMVGIPAVSHTVEFAIHWLRGTPNLRASILASILFTILSTSFNLHAMRRGVLIVGRGESSLLADLRSLPRLVLSFISSGLGCMPPCRPRAERGNCR